MTTFNEAETAKRALKKQVGKPPWLRGIFVAYANCSHFVRVVVAQTTRLDEEETLPPALGAVSIRVERDLE